MILENAPEVLTVPEVARLLRIDRNTAYELVRKGGLYGVRIGHAIRVPRSEVERFLSGASVNGLAPPVGGRGENGVASDIRTGTGR